MMKDTLIATVPILLIFAIIIHQGFAVIEPNILLSNFIFFIVLTPLVEEVAFRGFLQKMIAGKVAGRVFFITYANIITSVIFALFHLINNAPIHALLTFFPSLVFGLLYDRNSNLLPPIITHAIYNLNVFLIYTKL